MPTLRTLDGAVVTLGDGPRALTPTTCIQRDLELAEDTRDLILSHPPLPDISLGIITTRLLPLLIVALHRALDGAESAEIVDVGEVLARVAREDAR